MPYIGKGVRMHVSPTGKARTLRVGWRRTDAAWLVRSWIRAQAVSRAVPHFKRPCQTEVPVPRSEICSPSGYATLYPHWDHLRGTGCWRLPEHERADSQVR
eukprot:7379485-Prymnesium_polylepis.4